jgi:hypothetical protein
MAGLQRRRLIPYAPSAAPASASAEGYGETSPQLEERRRGRGERAKRVEPH